MGIMDIFSKQKMDLFFAKRHYEQCYQQRASKIKSFRATARKDLSFKYPYSLILMNNKSRFFLLFNKADGVFSVGIFADPHVPELVFMQNDAEFDDYKNAIQNYLIQERKVRGVMTYESYNSLISAHCFSSDFRNYAEKGYHIMYEHKIEDLSGAALFLNGRQIAVSAPGNRKNTGYFAEKIYYNIINKEATHLPRICVLSLVLSFYTYCSEDQSLHHDILFMNNEDFASKNSNFDSKKDVFALRDLLSFLEQGFNTDWEHELISETNKVLGNHKRYVSSRW